MERTQNMGPYKHEWSHILYMYVNSLISMACDTMSIKTRHATNQQYEKHVNINEE